MNKKCKTLITKMLLDGNKGERSISRELLDIPRNTKIEKIVDFSKMTNVSVSSFSRFVSKTGYPSFKHFSYDFNSPGEESEDIIDEANGIDTSLADYYTTAKRVSKNINKGKIFIISSRRGKSIGKLMNERLNDGGYDNRLYHETQDNLEEFVNDIQGNTLFLITLSGYSKKISEALSLISDLPGKKPKIIILTAGKWMNMFGNGDFISIGKIKKRDYLSDDWKNYNLCLLDVMTLVILIINSLEEEKEGRK